MNKNPYQSPASNIEVKDSEANQQYYIVSIKKFTILFFATLGLYTVYWFYKNWKLHKIYNGTSVWPVARGIFSIFFAHSLFREVKNTINQNNKQFDWDPSTLATAYVFLSIVSHGLDRMSMKGIGSPFTDFISILILPLLYFTLSKPQQAINLSQGDPDGSSNSMLTGANYVWILIGGVFWALVIFGLLVVFGFIKV